jgi:NTE family protein
MLCRFLRCLILAAGLLPVIACAGVQPRIGLVLSGGGAKGLAHVGVLKVLAEAGIRPVVITGTSMGSIVGGLAAMGYSAAAIESLVVSVDWQTDFVDPQPRTILTMEHKSRDDRYAASLPFVGGGIGLPEGLVAGQEIGKLLSRLTLPFCDSIDFHTLPIPFACVATDISTGETVVLDHGDLGTAIRASASLPFALTPVTLDGRLLVDGGLTKNFPVDVARAMGADVTIGVDVGTRSLATGDITSIVQIARQALGFADEADRRTERAHCTILIDPDVADFSILNFEDVREIIKRGEDAARRWLPQLDSLAARQAGGAPRPARALPSLSDSVRLAAVEVLEATTASRQTILTAANIHAPCTVTIRQTEEAIDRINSLQVFETTSYRLRRGPDGDTLRIVTRNLNRDRFRFSLRYDSFTHAAILLNATFQGIGTELGTTSIDLTLGTETVFDVEYALPLAFQPGVGLQLEANYAFRTNSIYLDQRSFLSYGLRSAYCSAFVGTIYSRRLLVGGGIRGEYAEITPEFSLAAFGDVRRFVSEYVRVEFDSYDRTLYPRSGIGTALWIDHAKQGLGAPFTFTRWIATASTAVPLAARFTVLAGGFVGTGTGNELPLHYYFSAGGMRSPVSFPAEHAMRISLPGYKTQELTGRQLQTLWLGTRYDVTPSLSVQFLGDIVKRSDDQEIVFRGARYAWGAGATVGYLTPLGPAEFSLMSGPEHSLLPYVSIGFDF